MKDFFYVLSDPSIPFVRYAFIAGLLSSIPFGIIGTWVTINRISYLAGAIAHSALAGIGASLYLSARYGITWFPPLAGALISSVAASLIIGAVSLKAKEREDTIIGAIWAIGMSTGLIFISKTPGYVSPMTYLFGNILIISASDLLMLAILDVLIIAGSYIFYHQFQAISFDEEFARIRGIKTERYYIILLLMTALTVVLMTTITGIVMVIALLTIPAATAGLFTGRIWTTIITAVGLTIVFTSSGLVISYEMDLPTGAVIIVTAGAVYLCSIIIRKIITKLNRRPRRF